MLSILIELLPQVTHWHVRGLFGVEATTNIDQNCQNLKQQDTLSNMLRVLAVSVNVMLLLLHDVWIHLYHVLLPF